MLVTTKEHLKNQDKRVGLREKSRPFCIINYCFWFYKVCCFHYSRSRFHWLSRFASMPSETGFIIYYCFGWNVNYFNLNHPLFPVFYSSACSSSVYWLEPSKQWVHTWHFGRPMALISCSIVLNLREVSPNWLRISSTIRLY